MARKQPDAARVVAGHVAGFPAGELPAAVVESTKRVILDTLGVILAGTGAGQGCQLLIPLIQARGGTAEATIFGYEGKVPASEAAMANGALAHALDFDDIHSTLPVHLSAFTVPTAFAVAEMVGHVSGADLLAAVALGNEVATRVGLAFHAGRDSPRWHPTLLPGYFSSTAVATRLLGLDAATTLDAFGITLYRTAGTVPFRGGERHLVEEVYYGFPAQAGVISAVMAQAGITAPNEVFEGTGGLFEAYFDRDYERDALTEGWGSRFEALDVALKPWPSVRGTHGFVEAALELVAETRLAPDDVAEIVLNRAHTENAMFPLRSTEAPRTSIDAKLSLPFVIATAVARGHVTVSDFLPAALADPAVRALSERVTVGSLAPEDPNRHGVLELLTRDGTRHTRPVPSMRGTPERPMSDEEIVAKFRSCASSAARPLPERQVEQAAELLLGLDGIADIAGVVSALGETRLQQR